MTEFRCVTCNRLKKPEFIASRHRHGHRCQPCDEAASKIRQQIKERQR